MKMDDVDGSQMSGDDEERSTSSGETHAFDSASGEADDRAEAVDDDSLGGPIEPPEGRLEIVAEPVRYRRGPVYALLAIALVPTIALFLLYRWADSEADAYAAELERIDAERGAASADASGSTSIPTTAPSAAPTTTLGESEGDDTADAVAETVGGTSFLSYRRTPSAIAALANARSLAENLSDFADRLDVGVCFEASLDGIRVSAHGSSIPFVPGSVQKLLTAAVALDVLGPDYVFETSVAVPPAVDGVVEGDIYLIGGGDPLLTSDDYPVSDDTRPAFHTTSLDPLADAVANSGVTRIRGTVIGDGSRYDDEFSVDSWASGIAGVDAGPYDALFVNDARVLGRSGRESDPNQGAAREFVRLLGERGVQVDNGWGSGIRSTLVPVIGSVTSAPLDDVIEEMLVNSDNDTAELLLKEVGLVANGDGTREAGLAAMSQWLTDRGIATIGVELADGSGLSNGNRLTCEAVVQILRAVDRERLANSLPIAGRTGTLADEFTGSPVVGELRAKTGTLNVGSVDPPAVKALAGYLPDPAGTIEFALIANTPGAASEQVYQTLWNALGDRFATHPAGPTLDDLGPRPFDAAR